MSRRAIMTAVQIGEIIASPRQRSSSSARPADVIAGVRGDDAAHDNGYDLADRTARRADSREPDADDGALVEARELHGESAHDRTHDAFDAAIASRRGEAWGSPSPRGTDHSVGAVSEIDRRLIGPEEHSRPPSRSAGLDIENLDALLIGVVPPHDE